MDPGEALSMGIYPPPPEPPTEPELIQPGPAEESPAESPAYVYDAESAGKCSEDHRKEPEAQHQPTEVSGDAALAAGLRRERDHLLRMLCEVTEERDALREATAAKPGLPDKEQALSPELPNSVIDEEGDTEVVRTITIECPGEVEEVAWEETSCALVVTVTKPRRFLDPSRVKAVRPLQERCGTFVLEFPLEDRHFRLCPEEAALEAGELKFVLRKPRGINAGRVQTNAKMRSPEVFALSSGASVQSEAEGSVRSWEKLDEPSLASAIAL
jgi:hypothetical protein